MVMPPLQRCVALTHACTALCATQQELAGAHLHTHVGGGRARRGVGVPVARRRRRAHVQRGGQLRAGDAAAQEVARERGGGGAQAGQAALQRGVLRLAPAPAQHQRSRGARPPPAGA